jgi:hypothetical protein
VLHVFKQNSHENQLCAIRKKYEDSESASWPFRGDRLSVPDVLN